MGSLFLSEIKSNSELAEKFLKKIKKSVVGNRIVSNVSNKEQTIRKNTRVGQLVITLIVIADFVKDKGAFGSTGE